VKNQRDVLRIEFAANGDDDHKGFRLDESIAVDASIVVLTGRNGSGKTRFIESIKNGKTRCSIDGKNLVTTDSVLYQHDKLIPSVEGRFDNFQYGAMVASTLGLYEKMKARMLSPLSMEERQNQDTYHGGDEAISFVDLYDLAQATAFRTGKSPDNLSAEDLVLNFQNPNKLLLGTHNVSLIFNQYIKRKHTNEYHQWLAQHKGRDVTYLEDDAFEEHFGLRPWLKLNAILRETFDGKFEYPAPDETSQSYSHHAVLHECSSSTPMPTKDLSSGEQSLLWLAVTLFNSQSLLDRPAIAPKLVLFDEPDAFLHPKMVLKMYAAFVAFSKEFGAAIILTTHSPSTVALSPSNGLFLTSDSGICATDKDSAVAELLSGVTQISISPKNRRQVFVESRYDDVIYQEIFNKISTVSKKIDPKVSLAFVCSGPKLPEAQIREALAGSFGSVDEEIVRDFLDRVNGVGSCSQTYAAVESLSAKGNQTVRGLVDWDGVNRSRNGVTVLAPNYAHSIENIALDPVCLALLLNIENPQKFESLELCGKQVGISTIIIRRDLIQNCYNWFVSKVFDRSNLKNIEYQYISGISIQGDSQYLEMRGHDLEHLIFSKIPEIRTICKHQGDGELKRNVVVRGMINLTECRLVPSVFEEAMVSLQSVEQ